MSYDFPPEFDVTRELLGISFTFPHSEEQETKTKFADAKQKYSKTIGRCFIRNKKDKNNYYLITSGKDEERIQCLLFLLEQMGLFINQEVLPFPLKVIRFFKPDICSDIKRDEFCAINDPHLTPFNKSLSAIEPDIEAFSLPLVIDQASFAILTKILCPQSNNLERLYKNVYELHNNEKTVVKMYLPALLPVCFQFTGAFDTDNYDYDDEEQYLDKIEIEVSFVKYDDFSAEQIRSQFEFALHSLDQCLCLRATFEACDRFKIDHLLFNEVNPEIKDLVYYGFSEHQDTINDPQADSDLFIVIPPGQEGGTELLEKFKNEIPNIYKYYSLIYCKTCKCVYNPFDKTDCKFPEHTG